MSVSLSFVVICTHESTNKTNFLHRTHSKQSLQVTKITQLICLITTYSITSRMSAWWRWVFPGMITAFPAAGELCAARDDGISFTANSNPLHWKNHTSSVKTTHHHPLIITKWVTIIHWDQSLKAKKFQTIVLSESDSMSFVWWNDDTESMVTIRSPFCGHNLA